MTSRRGVNLSRRRIITGVAVAIAAAALIAVYGAFDPATTPFPRCPFLMLTGWQCPGCGSQRAAHALLNGDIAGAWELNAVMVCLLPLIVLLVVAELLRSLHPRLYAVLNSRELCLAAAVAFIAWCILRNIL